MLKLQTKSSQIQPEADFLANKEVIWIKNILIEIYSSLIFFFQFVELNFKIDLKKSIFSVL